MIDIIIDTALVIMGVALFVVMALCAIAPLFISKDSTAGEQPLVKLGEGRGSTK